MGIITSAVSKNNGITFVGKNYMVEMIETKDGMKYKYKKVPTIEKTLDKKVGDIFLVSGLIQFFNFKLYAFLWIVHIVKIFVFEYFHWDENENFARDINFGVILLMAIICGMMILKMYIGRKKLFLYHGAEHKIIHAVDKGLELNFANIKRQPCYHDACGSMLAIFFITTTLIGRIFVKDILLFLPLVFAISLEIFYVKDTEKFPVLKGFYKIGQIVQEKFLAKEPEDKMIRDSIKAVKMLMELEQTKNG